MAPPMRRGSGRAARQGGFTYFGVIIAVMLIGMALAVAGTVARTHMQRERETQLLWVGHQYRDAFALYATQHGGRMPLALEQLIGEEQVGAPRRYLRRLYPDPMTGKPDWKLLMGVDGGIFGIYSSSGSAPLKVKGCDDRDKAFEDAPCYRAGQVSFEPRRAVEPLAKAPDVC